MDRRRFIELAALASAALPVGCRGSSSPSEPPQEVTGGRLAVRWAPPTSSLEAGEHELGLSSGRDGFLRIPAGYVPETVAPLALLLHGAGRNAHEWAGGFPLFDELGLIVLSIDSRGVTWELRFGGFGADAAFIDRALTQTFERCNIDPSRMAIAGFSDGASYALSLGLTNGDLFTHVLGFSPGYIETDGRYGQPPVFLSHGTNDGILPVAFTRDLAVQLASDGHVVRYEEFDGGHTLPYAIGELGMDWFVNGG